MKRLILLFIVAGSVSSCSPMMYSESFYKVDFSEYTSKGFFITVSNSVSFDYDPVEYIEVEVQDGYEKTESKPVQKFKDGKKQDSVYGDGNLSKFSTSVKRSSPERALEMAVNIAKENGANGIINFKITRIPLDNFGINNKYTATGMAIKRNKIWGPKNFGRKIEFSTFYCSYSIYYYS